MLTTWTDTSRMPADDGTREDESGKLRVGRILAPRRALFIEVFSGSGHLTVCVSQYAQIEVSTLDQSLNFLSHGILDFLVDKGNYLPV